MSLRLWNGYELVKLLNSRKLATVLPDLMRFEEWCDEYKRRGASRPTLGAPPNAFSNCPNDSEWEKIRECLKLAEELCDESGWCYAAGKIALINIHLQCSREDCDWSSLSADLRNASDMIVSAMWTDKFVQVSTVYSTYVGNDALCGEEVKKAFPSALEDIKEAGNCIAVDCGTAAVFHLMRAVEWGMRALATDLQVLGTPRKSALIPIEFSEWDKILDHLYPAVQKKVDALPPGQTKQELQEFYFPLLLDLRGFKDAFRNHVMHTRKTYTQKAADDVLDHVRRFMALLSTRISE
jgi:hypothetical protein